MNPWTRFSLAVRRRETPFYDRLYRIAWAVRAKTAMPVIPGLHAFLYSEWAARTNLWHTFWRVVYYEPMFKSQCHRVGSGFKLWYAGNGTCRILGMLRIELGDNVQLFDNVSLVGLKIFDNPRLCVGDNTYLGPSGRFMVAKEIRIGSHTVIGSRNMFMDNPGHPSDALARCAPGFGSPEPESVRPVVVGDFCATGAGCYFYPGASVSDGVVVGVGTHVRGHIPPFAFVVGNPGRVARLLPIAPGLRDRVGDERFEGWREAQRAYMAEHPDIPMSAQP